MTPPDGRVRRAALIAALVVLADQVTKHVVAEHFRLYETVALTPFLALTYVRNTGAAFSVFANAPQTVRLPFLILVTVVAVGMLITFLRRTPPERRMEIAALGGILGGAVGNLVDRVRYGEVVDFVVLHWGDWQWPAFNVADSAITVGVVVLLLRRGESSGG